MQAAEQIDVPAALPASPAPKKSIYRWLVAVLFVAGVSGFYTLGLQQYFSWDSIRANLDVFQAQVQGNLFAAVLVFFVVYTAVTALSLPIASILTLLAGALFGRFLGTGVVLFAATLGATLAFLSSRFLFRDWVRSRLASHLEALNQGVEKDGAFYLFSLRLVPLFPFFLINLGMGLTPMRTWTYFWVSLVGMLPGTFLYINAGRSLATLESPEDLLSTSALVSLALLGLAPLVFRKLIQWQIRPRTWGVTVATVLVLAIGGLGARTYFRYQTADVMHVAVREFTNHEYPDDPANRSVHFGKYDGRELKLVKKDDAQFDFEFTAPHAHIAKIVFRDIDVSLMTPGLPEWTKSDPGLRRIALTDRQWNRQQVRFDPKSAHVEISGGDGFEKERIFSAELAKNCLNTGLWEILLFVEENGKKALYYHGWFTFPLGHYQTIFEHNTGFSYWQHWYYLEHWFDPAGVSLHLDDLRTVRREKEVPASFGADEDLLVAGEQLGKRRIMIADNVVYWKDFFDGRKIRFATFLPPGRYSVQHPWKNEYWRLEKFDKAILRDIDSPANSALHELELVFSSTKLAGKCRFLMGGIELAKVPQLRPEDYAEGLYMPMGIGVPPFFQSYNELQKNPPQRSPYYCFMLDENNRWINHHEVAVDGPVVHRDAVSQDVLHVYMLSYERHTLINHFVIRTKD